MLCGGVHGNPPLRSLLAHGTQCLNEVLGIHAAGFLKSLGKCVDALVNAFAKIGQYPVAIRPYSLNARQLLQLLQITLVFGCVNRHKVSIAGIKPALMDSGILLVIISS